MSAWLDGDPTAPRPDFPRAVHRTPEDIARAAEGYGEHASYPVQQELPLCGVCGLVAARCPHDYMETLPIVYKWHVVSPPVVVNREPVLVVGKAWKPPPEKPATGWLAFAEQSRDERARRLRAEGKL